jgi:gas vesicle protein
MSKKGIFALAIGIATGVLFSPTTGKKFREKLQKEIKKGGYGKDSIYGHFKGLAEEIKQATEDGIQKSGLDKKAAKVIKKVNTAKNKLIRTAVKTEAKIEAKVKNTVKKTVKKAKAIKKQVPTTKSAKSAVKKIVKKAVQPKTTTKPKTTAKSKPKK